MSGANLDRYRSNPVLLDTHDRHSLSSVIGRTEVRVEGRNLIARAYYAPTPSGDQAWALVEGGFVRGMSVGYTVDPTKVKRIRAGETDGDGASAVEGPASIVNGWELAEISNVPVPADADAVRRAFYDGIPQLKERPVSEKLTRAMGAAQPPAHGDNETPPKADEQERSKVTDLSEEILARRIRGITPRGLEGEADFCILSGYSVEKAREHLLAKYAEKHQPIGTPEPSADAPTDAKRAQTLPPEVTDDVLVRSLENLQ